jgi:hypothetical protein
VNQSPEWSKQFRAGTVTGIGLGLMFGFSLAEGANPNPPSWLAMVPVYLFSIGMALIGLILARRDDRDASPFDPSERS